MPTSHTQRLLLLVALLASGVPLAGQPLEEPQSSSVASVVFLVRHAEPLYPPPEDAPRDPPLNLMGQHRADVLARLLASAGIERIFSSDSRRTQETAAPVADLLGLDVTSYDPKDLETLARMLLAMPGTSLVVGHSDTTPQLVVLLGGEPGEPIDGGTEFDRLYVVVGAEGQPPTTLTLRYGSPLPENWRELARTRRAPLPGPL